MKKINGLFLSLGLIAGLASCAGNGSGNSQSVQVDVWGAPATEKILQDVHNIYDNIRTDAAINIVAAKGEYESQHIILTSKGARASYELEYSELRGNNGETFSKDNIDVFHEKYLELTSNFDRTEMPLGHYPDALIPYDAIVKANENYVEANSNQGLYFRFNVPLNQKEGTYTGSATIKVGGKSYSIPITLVVENIVVSEVNHAKSQFLTRWFQSRGELDTTQAMHDKYSRFLYEYRLCGSDLILDNSHTKAEVDEYVELAYDHMQNPKCSTVSIPCRKDPSVGFDGSSLRMYLTAFAKKSFETGYNMMKKLAFYNNYVDEPQFWGPGGLPATQNISTKYRSVIKSLADTLAADTTITASNKDEVIASLRDVPNIITAWYEDDYAPWVDTWCPEFHYYDAEYSRANYDSQKEKWWYGCIDPKAPYSTYHIEDTLLSARLEPWMKAEYDVVGSLYWATTVYAEWNGSRYEDIEDYYSGSASRFPRVNGDGWLLYPGAKYGIDGPLPSLRLEAIRDGLEEYELLLALKNNYKNLQDTLGEEVNISIDKIFSLLRSSLYYGTRVTAKNDTFYAARKVLFDLAKMNQNTLTSIVDYYDDTYGKYVFTVISPTGTEIKVNNVILSPEKNIGGYNKYTIDVELNNDKNYFNLTASKNGQSYDYSQYIGGKVSVNSVSNAKVSDLSKETVTPVATMIDANTVDETLTGKLIQVDVPQSNNNSEQAFRLKGSLLNGIDETTSKVVFHVYYGGEDDLKCVFSAKYMNNPVYFDLANANLKKGMNNIEIVFEEKDWSISGNIDYLSIYLGEGKGQPARTIYLSDSVVYEK